MSRTTRRTLLKSGLALSAGAVAAGAAPRANNSASTCFTKFSSTFLRSFHLPSAFFFFEPE